jgi:leucyl aminopeptidase
MKLDRFAASIFALVSIPSTFASPELRLIETNPGERRWASPSELQNLSEASHASGKCGGFMDITDYPIDLNAPRTKTLALDGLEPQEQARIIPLLKQVDGIQLISIVTNLSQFKNRLYNTAEGVAAAQYLKAEYEKIAQGRAGIRIELFQHKKFKQPSVIATIEGNGPNRDEIVVIGGHLDSISSGKLAPGADDNASGTATLLWHR